MTASAMVSQAARAGWLPLGGTRLAFLGTPAAATSLGLLAAGELAADKLPALGSRTQPTQVAGRLASGALCGAALGLPQRPIAGLAAGVAGAAVGTVLTAALRSALAERFGADAPAALVEDALVMLAAGLIMREVRRPHG